MMDNHLNPKNDKDKSSDKPKNLPGAGLPKLKFDHEKKSIAEAVGVSDEHGPESKAMESQVISYKTGKVRHISKLLENIWNDEAISAGGKLAIAFEAGAQLATIKLRKKILRELGGDEDDD